MAKFALLIGVSDYEPGLNSLPAAVRDVQALQRVLKDPALGEFDEVRTVNNPDPQTMQYEIETLFSSRLKDDLILLFFSGHGIKDEAGKLHLATRITHKTSKNELIRSTAVPAHFIHDVMNNCRAKRQVIILDCCFSGAFDPSLITRDDGFLDLQGQLGAEGRVVLTSSSSTQYSYEQQGAELSIYTRYLIEGIETGAGDRDEDGNVSVLELHEYACNKVQETAPSMTPKIITLKDKGFEIILSKAKISDPKLKYRKEVQKYARQGGISPIGRRILDSVRTQLRLSPEESVEVENEVLRPYRERLENLEKYREALIETVQYEYPFSNELRDELDVFQKMLGLRSEDAEPVERDIINQHLFQKQTVTSQVDQAEDNLATSKLEEFHSYAIVLEEVPQDKKIAILKVVRGLTDLGLKDAKDLVESVPHLVNEHISREAAEEAKLSLEAAGGKVLIIKCN
jgi:ribosomal protein L7/L12